MIHVVCEKGLFTAYITVLSTYTITFMHTCRGSAVHKMVSSPCATSCINNRAQHLLLFCCIITYALSIVRHHYQTAGKNVLNGETTELIPECGWHLLNSVAIVLVFLCH